ncbi:MAG: hypothetical protein ACYCZR_08080 [Burkholderiales bacterium]
MSRYDREVEKIEVAVTFKHITDRAVLVNDGDKDVWLPLSQVEVNDGGDDESTFWGDLEPGQIIEIVVPEWIAKNKGLI